MRKKILYFDTETTGLDPVKNDIIQLSGCIEIDGKIEEEFNIFMQPFSYDNISDEAISIHGLTLDMIKTYQTSKDGYRHFVSILQKYCDKFNNMDKYYPAGYNVSFDINFLAEFFKKHNDKFLGSWINWKALDPLPYLRLLDFMDMINLPNYKLETVAAHFNINLKAHDAMSDITATRMLIQRIMRRIC